MSISPEEQRLIKNATDSFIQKDMRWKDTLDDVYKYLAPHRQSEEQLGQDSSEMFRHIYDSTGIRGLRSLSSNILSGAMPQWTRWALISPGPLIPRDEEHKQQRDDLADALESTNDVIFQELNTSNFYGVMQQALEDFCIQQMCVSVNPAEGGGLEFKHFSPFHYAFAKSANGLPDHVYIRERFTGFQLRELYEDSLRQHPEVLRDMIEDSVKEHDTLRITVPNESGGYMSMLILRSGHSGVDGKMITLERQDNLTRQPFKVARWGEDHYGLDGFGPGMEAYTDVRFVNALREHALSNMMLQNTGVYTAVNDGILNTNNVRIEPGAVIPVFSNDNQNPSLRPLPVGTNLDLAQFEINSLRSDILKAFFADRFSQVGDSKLSPTEVLLRAKIIAQELGPAYSQLQREFMQPVIEDAVDILKQQKRIDKSVRIGDGVLEVVFKSQLAQAQKIQDTDSVLQFMAIVNEQSQLDQTVAPLLDRPEAIYTLAESLQVPRSVIRGRDEVKRINEDAAKQMQALQQQQLGGQPSGQGQQATIQ